MDCHVDNLELNPGVYLISIGITDGHQMHTYDHWYQGYELRVRQPADDFEPEGLVTLRWHWSSPVPDEPSQLLR
jgi:hypothetical protein